MKTRNIFSTAVLAISLAACTSEDNLQQPTPANGSESNQSIPFSATIQGSASTRGLTEGDGTITAKWEMGEQMALVHGETIDVVKVTSVDASGNATIEGKINNAANGERVCVIYAGTAQART